jgi:hypothetical protein
MVPRSMPNSLEKKGILLSFYPLYTYVEVVGAQKDDGQYPICDGRFKTALSAIYPDFMENIFWTNFLDLFFLS